MKQGDLIEWSEIKNHDYMDRCNAKLGIFLKELEQYDHWVLAEIIDNFGKLNVVMLQKSNNPI